MFVSKKKIRHSQDHRGVEMNDFGDTSHFLSTVVSWEIKSFFFLLGLYYSGHCLYSEWTGVVFVYRPGLINVWGATSGGLLYEVPGWITLLRERYIWHVVCTSIHITATGSVQYVIYFCWCSKRVSLKMDKYYCNYKQSEEMYDLFCQFGLFLYDPEHQIKNIPMYVVMWSIVFFTP